MTFCLLLLSALSFAGPVSMKVVAPLHQYEVWDTLAFHADVLWLGKELDEKAQHNSCIEAYNSSGQLLKRIDIPFTPRHLKPYGTNSILVTGARSWPWKTYYAEIKYLGGTQFSKRVFQFPEKFQVEHFAAKPGKLLFQLAGDNAIMEWGNFAPNIFPARIHGPTEMELAQNYLFVIESNSIALQDDDNLQRLDLRTGKSEPTFTDHYRWGLKNVLYLKNSKRLAVAEMFASQILLIDVETNKLQKTIKIPGWQPRALGELGHCLVTASYESREVAFVDLKSFDAAPEVIETWNLTQLGSLFGRASSLAIDEKSKTLFARSTHLCQGCAASMSSVVQVRSEGSKVFEKCLGDF